MLAVQRPAIMNLLPLMHICSLDVYDHVNRGRAIISVGDSHEDILDPVNVSQMSAKD